MISLDDVAITGTLGSFCVKVCIKRKTKHLKMLHDPCYEHIKVRRLVEGRQNNFLSFHFSIIPAFLGVESLIHRDLLSGANAFLADLRKVLDSVAVEGSFATIRSTLPTVFTQDRLDVRCGQFLLWGNYLLYHVNDLITTKQLEQVACG